MAELVKQHTRVLQAHFLGLFAVLALRIRRSRKVTLLITTFYVADVPLAFAVNRESVRRYFKNHEIHEIHERNELAKG